MTVLLLTPGIDAQAAGAAQAAVAAESRPMPEFDVSTVKPNDTGSGSIRVSMNDDILQATNVQIKMLMEEAYHVEQDDIFGLPHWAEVSHYDIVAKVVDADPQVLKDMTREQRALMVRHLIEGRFQLKTHTEVRMLPVLNLVVAKGGSRLTPSAPREDDAKGFGGSMHSNNGDMTARHISVADIVSFLTDQTHVTVIDKTGLSGRFDFEFKWQREDQGPQSGLREDLAPTLYTALQEQLGLKLESGKGPVTVLVVDHIAAPSEN
jgi:uncharacterized protein (TIGR03435 family)